MAQAQPVVDVPALQRLSAAGTQRGTHARLRLLADLSATLSLAAAEASAPTCWPQRMHMPCMRPGCGGHCCCSPARRAQLRLSPRLRPSWQFRCSCSCARLRQAPPSCACPCARLAHGHCCIPARVFSLPAAAAARPSAQATTWQALPCPAPAPAAAPSRPRCCRPSCWAWLSAVHPIAPSPRPHGLCIQCSPPWPCDAHAVHAQRAAEHEPGHPARSCPRQAGPGRRFEDCDDMQPKLLMFWPS